MNHRKEILIVLTAIMATVLLGQHTMSYKENRHTNKTQRQDTIPSRDASKYEKATFAAGCFWHVQYEFDQLPGVVSTIVGYTGGTTRKPTYEQVCSGKTGHAEAVEITFDANKITYDTLLDVFFKIHDPTKLNRQGPDVGYQYRSAIFYHSDSQRRAALAAIDELSKSGKFSAPVVTEVKPAGPFYKAERYHQKYVEKRRGRSCPAF
jgi:methionine-S-sulfoxide reductase